MKRFIYADNAATTKLDSDALNEMLPWLQDEYGNASQPILLPVNPGRLFPKREQRLQAVSVPPEVK